MKLNRRTFAFLMVGALVLCASDAFGGIPPLPPGARPHPGWAWCPRCEGRRYVPSGFLGWTSKICPKCNGYGMIRLPPPPPPVQPRPMMRHNHHNQRHVPAVDHQPKHMQHHSAQPKHNPTPQPHDNMKRPPRR